VYRIFKIKILKKLKFFSHKEIAQALALKISGNLYLLKKKEEQAMKFL
jgi:hypothetical protein